MATVCILTIQYYRHGTFKFGKNAFRYFIITASKSIFTKADNDYFHLVFYERPNFKKMRNELSSLRLSRPNVRQFHKIKMYYPGFYLNADN